MRSVPFRVALAVLGGPVLLSGAALALRNVWSDRLPAEVATHWGPSGAPDRATDLDVLTTWTLLAALVLAVAFTIAALVLLRRGRGVHRPLLGLASGLAALPVAALATSMLATLDAASWREASGAALAIPVILATAGAAGAVAWFIAPDVPPEQRPVDATAVAGAQSVGLSEHERATWVGGSTNAGLAVLCVVALPVVVAVVGALSGSPAPWSSLLVPLGIGLLAALGVGSVRVTIDADAVSIRMGVLGYPRRTVPLDDITSAGTTTLGVLGNGGLGVRTNASGDVAFKCRGGDALVLTLRSNRRVLATVDRPDQAAGLVNDLVRQARNRAG
ncbi:DUF1648 domain-containing protein [Saccharomonospora azurea]